MTFLPGTILARKEPKNDPLDKLRVVADSPGSDSNVSGWVAGPTNAAVIVTPHEEFGGNEVLPLNIAAELYTVEYEPPVEDVQQPVRPAPVDPRKLPTAEQQFAADAAKKQPRKSNKV